MISIIIVLIFASALQIREKDTKLLLVNNNEELFISSQGEYYLVINESNINKFKGLNK